jgi:hypothetical protein
LWSKRTPSISAGFKPQLSRRSPAMSNSLTLDRSFLTELAGTLPPRLQHSVDEGLRMVLQL